MRLYPGLAAVKPGSGLKTAVQTLEPFVAQYPKRADVQIGFAQLLARTGQGDLACRRAAAASAAVPNDHERLGEAADVCWQAGNMGEARSMLENILRNIRTTAMCSSSLAALKSVSADEPQRLMRLCAL